MANDFAKIGRVAPVYNGVWSAAKGYARLDIVSTTDRATAYIARKDVPAGAALSDESYWGIVLDVKDVIDTVRGAASVIDASLDERSTDLERITGGHFRQIVLDNEHDTRTYKEVDGLIVEGSAVPGSGYIACPKHLCLEFGDADARCYLYFYNLADGVYIPRWDILNGTTSTGIKNYINASSRKANMFDIPDDVYMQVSVAVGTVRMYGWDGEPFGMPLNADESMRTTNGANVVMHEDGSSGVIIPGAAKYVCCKDSEIFSIWGYRDGVLEVIDTSHARRFWVPPDRYEWFKLRLYFGTGGEYSAKTYMGDVSEYVSAVFDVESERAAARARKVIDACNLTDKMVWTLGEPLYVRNGNGNTYKPNVEYNGIPYSSQWFQTHFVGWHVSPHTFVNAAADVNSVLYLESAVTGDGKIGPYYGIVCSAFATMCDGWPYPQTNAGFVYDPDVSLSFAAKPPIGAIYSDLLDHCLIPERIDTIGDVNAVSMYEGAYPVSGRRTRYSSIDKTIDPSAYKNATLDGYLDGYGYIAHHLHATDMHSAAPYADFDDLEIVTAGAVPYRGDRCVHTSEDAEVYINIRDLAPATLYLTAPDGSETAIPLQPSTAKVDIKSYLAQSGIYHIRTDTNAERASFEYHVVEPVRYTLTDGVVNFDRNDWWYAVANLNGSRVFENVEICAMPSSLNNSYADWSTGGHYVSKIHCVFRKGAYGAYPVTALKVSG